MILSLENLQSMTQTPGGTLELVSSLLISLSATVVFVAFLLTALVFWPFMVYRAGLEEAMLAREFSEYADYQRNVGRFFWKTGLRRGGVEKGNAV